VNNNHVEKNITSASMIPSDLVMLSTADITEDGTGITNKRAIGLIMGIGMGDNRPVNTQGEIGSKYLVTLINEGQQYLSFQRLIPLSDGEQNSRFKSILPLLYEVDDVMSYDFDENPKYSRPIQIVLEIMNAEGKVETEIWLKNASVGTTAMTFTAGSNYTVEPAGIAWEEPIFLDPAQAN
jgi:hypothetical protein